jgi:hypothetical protein
VRVKPRSLHVGEERRAAAPAVSVFDGIDDTSMGFAPERDIKLPDDAHAPGTGAQIDTHRAGSHRVRAAAGAGRRAWISAV